MVDSDTNYVDINNTKMKIDMEADKELEAEKSFSMPPRWF